MFQNMHTHMCTHIRAHTHTHTHSHIHSYTRTAVYFEQSEWEQCLKTCEVAVERGREHRADFKIIAKSVSVSLCTACSDQCMVSVAHVVLRWYHAQVVW